MDTTSLWSHWQELLDPFRIAFTAPGWDHFVTWITGLALNVEEHTITQSLVALDRTQDWKGLETENNCSPNRRFQLRTGRY